ncbi:MAG: hypothetical protein QXP98_04025 [Thermoproteus sp.]
MLDIILSPFAAAFGAWNVFKVYPSVAFAAMAAASAALAMKAFDKDWKVGMLAGLASTTYILNLRISWDCQRQLLSSLLLLLSVLALERWGRVDTPKRAVAAAALLIATELSHEAAGVAAIAIALVLIYRGIRTRDPYSAAAGAISLLAGVVLEIWYWGRPIGYNVHTGALELPGIVTTPEEQDGAVISYIVASFGLVIPQLSPH